MVIVPSYKLKPLNMQQFAADVRLKSEKKDEQSPGFTGI
jgi:hypothetical protein